MTWRQKALQGVNDQVDDVEVNTSWPYKAQRPLGPADACQILAGRARNNNVGYVWLDCNSLASELLHGC